MNTNELIERIAGEQGVAKDHVRKILDSTFQTITAAATRGEEIAISGFGKFKVTERAERPGRNPVTGEALTISCRQEAQLFAGQKHPRCAEQRRRTGCPGGRVRR